MGKFRVLWRMEKQPFAGTSPAPKHGPQKAVRMVAPGGHQAAERAVFREPQHHGLACGVDREPERAVAEVAAVEDIGHGAEVVVEPARAARDDALVDVEFAVPHLGEEGSRGPFAVQDARGLGVDRGEDVGEVLVELPDGVCVRGVEGQGDHRLDPVEVDDDGAVVIGALARI